MGFPIQDSQEDDERGDVWELALAVLTEISALKNNFCKQPEIGIYKTAYSKML